MGGILHREKKDLSISDVLKKENLKIMLIKCFVLVLCSTGVGFASMDQVPCKV